MKRSGVVVLMLALMSLTILPLTAAAQQGMTPAQEMTPPPPVLEVDQYAFCAAVEDHQPVNPTQTFPAGTEKVYLWTAILNPGTETEITHVWYRGDVKVAEVPLAIRYSRTRTWSTKTILPSWTGPWHVDVVDDHGNVLGSYAFTILEAMGSTPMESMQ